MADDPGGIVSDKYQYFGDPAGVSNLHNEFVSELMSRRTERSSAIIAANTQGITSSPFSLAGFTKRESQMDLAPYRSSSEAYAGKLGVSLVQLESSSYREPSIGFPEGRRLSQGETVAVRLNVSDKRWDSGIVAEAGERYEVNASGVWQDGDLQPCSAAGFFSNNLEWWRRPVFSLAARMRPVVSDYRWCSLVAEVGDGQLEEVGSRLPAVIEAKQSGTLKFFVNDVVFNNNKGSLQVYVRRLPR